MDYQCSHLAVVRAPHSSLYTLRRLGLNDLPKDPEVPYAVVSRAPFDSYHAFCALQKLPKPETDVPIIEVVRLLEERGLRVIRRSEYAHERSLLRKLFR